MSNDIHRAVIDRGITRLCHFTNSANLPNILNSKNGIVSTAELAKSAGAIFIPTDRQRLDGYENDVCCSIEYPNAWYLDVARQNEKVFGDWAVVFIHPSYLWKDGTKFAPRNASAGGGRLVSAGTEAFFALFAEHVAGAGGNVRTRGAKHLCSCPTDQQAEVLVPARVQLTDITGFAVADQGQAKRETVRLAQLGVSFGGLKLIVAPMLFDKHQLSAHIRNGVKPAESEWLD